MRWNTVRDAYGNPGAPGVFNSRLPADDLRLVRPQFNLFGAVFNGQIESAERKAVSSRTLDRKSQIDLSCCGRFRI